MKKILIFGIFLIFQLTNAQHCSYCGSSIIVLKVHTIENPNTIANLEIRLVKKKHNKIIESQILPLYQVTNFPFIQDGYSVIIPRNLNVKDWIIKINSVCEQENEVLQTYEETEIKISENDKYPLCDNFDSFEYNLIDGNRVFNPIEVILKRKLCE